VQGHLGLTPQSIAQLGGFKMQGKDDRAAQQLIADAQALTEAGCFSLVLEAIPHDLAAKVTEAVPIPTIGIGAGPHCDGQVLVLHDMAGLFDRFVPKFVKQYAQLGTQLSKAVQQFQEEVQNGTFPKK
jgi:3-methyl-2-oxobutanoate hydroxymethyltransferase